MTARRMRKGLNHGDLLATQARCRTILRAMTISALAGCALGAGTPVHAVLQLQQVNIYSSADIVPTLGATQVAPLGDDARGGTQEFFQAIRTAVEHKAPPFQPLRALSFQQVSGINGVNLDVPVMGLFNQVAELRAQTQWSAVLYNSLVPLLPNAPAKPRMEFYIFGGEIEFDCYNCFLKPTTLSLEAEIVSQSRDQATRTTLWKYSARLTSNGFAPPTFDTSASIDPQGIGLPGVEVTQGPGAVGFRVEILPFLGVLELPEIGVTRGLFVDYLMNASATGDIALEGSMRASLGDPFDIVEGGRPGMLFDGQTVGALLVPVPEPAQWFMLASGLGLLGGLRLRSGRGKVLARQPAGA